jgi:hypothetical protein
LGYDEKNKNIVGLQEDYELTKRKDKDNFLLEFWEYLEANIPKAIVKANIQLSFKEINEKEVAIVEVRRSDIPIYLQKKGEKILYLRNRNKTEPLTDPEEIAKYVSKHF